MIQTLAPIAHIDRMLIDLLRSLQAEDWNRQTLAPLWTVKDVALHLLDGNIRGISMSKDQFFGITPPEIRSYQDLVGFLNALNADWIKATRRISPRLLISLLESTNAEYHAHLASLDPDADALFAVGWAGEDTSPNWFHIAREYTEKWHHQQQIRVAVGQDDALLREELYTPLLETFMRALPHHYRNVAAPAGTVLQFSVEGIAPAWWLRKASEGWVLMDRVETSPQSRVLLPRGLAWRIFTKAVPRAEALSRLQIEGDVRLGQEIVGMLSVMA
ncbi:TIGR03083 family protein [Catalinimonas alkaloidigena]|uniref:TIGR03083 family protein n=1 Tax=Catalinimonas alkaloidigena TaxID=1075417 RepID=A0A1G9IJK0_9BACT|nr:maleylpyruvate isomerase N-terminal domain-containing protein [Catalinimonas alkaloidigena]SDL25391.1 TIGR03083 family protein [Catalinimonas alkaloidigena]